MKNTLKLNRDFRRLYAKGRSCAAGTVVVYALPRRRGKGRIGITAGKAVGCAVKRNRAKRLIRESYARLSPRVKYGYDLVFVARAKTPSVKCGAVLRDMGKAMMKLDLLDPENK